MERLLDVIPPPPAAISTPGLHAMWHLVARHALSTGLARVAFFALATISAPMVLWGAAKLITHHRRAVLRIAISVTSRFPHAPVFQTIVRHAETAPSKFGVEVLRDCCGGELSSVTLGIARHGMVRVAEHFVNAAARLMALVCVEWVSRALELSPPLTRGFAAAAKSVLTCLGDAPDQHGSARPPLTWLELYYVGLISQTDCVLSLIRASRRSAVPGIIILLGTGLPPRIFTCSAAPLGLALDDLRRSATWIDLGAWQAVADCSSLGTLLVARVVYIGLRRTAPQVTVARLKRELRQRLVAGTARCVAIMILAASVPSIIQGTALRRFFGRGLLQKLPFIVSCTVIPLFPNR